jgi:hypothetical protein
MINHVKKIVKGVSRWNIIKYQLLTHCFINRILLSEADLDCLTYLGDKGEEELTDFCIAVTQENIFKSPQTVRNAITKAEKYNLIVKKGKNKKKVSLHPNLNIQTRGTILLDYKLLST